MMAVAELEYFRKKYKADEMLQDMIKQGDYRNIMRRVFSVNTEALSQRSAVRSVENWRKILSRPTMPQRKYVIPEIVSIMPTREEFNARSVAQVDGISGTLRTALTEKLRDSVNTFVSRFKEPTYVRRRISSNLEKEFEQNIRSVFTSYIKKDPRVEMPGNVHTIAVTEVRTAIGFMKERVAQKIRQENPGISPKKTWIHNPGLSKKPEYIRPGHAAVHKKTIGIDEYFNVPVYISIGGRKTRIGMTQMRHPHDVNADADQVIGCHCDCEYSV